MDRRVVVFLLVFFWIVGGYAQDGGEAGLPAGGIPLLPADSLLFGGGASVRPVEVSGQAFKNAYRITALAGGGNFGFRYRIESVIHKGDVLFLSFYTRSLQSRKETGESFMEVGIDMTVDGKYNWPPVFDRGLSFGSGWTLTQIPILAAREAAPGQAVFVIRGGGNPEEFELASPRLVNYGQGVRLDQLPRSVVHYDGDGPEASWRKAAAERMEKYGKGDIGVTVVDGKGRPVAGASVAIRMTKSAFGWGTAIASGILLDTVHPDGKRYRDTLMRYFNKIVFDNEVKSKTWARTDHERTLRALDWLDMHHIDARGHVMVWPSWKNSEHLLRFRRDTTGLRAEIMSEIAEETRVLKGRFKEWDVVNEPVANHDIMDTLGGRALMVDWFRAAGTRAPGVKLFLNDYIMFRGSGVGSESERFYDNIRYLKENGAPIDAIGEQAHIGGTPPGMDFVLARLDRFAAFGLPIQISEFDITSDDEEYKARYMRDFMTVIFSHPSTIGFVQWGFWAGQHWIPAAALWDKDWNLRANGKVYTELVTRTWATDVKGMTGEDGHFSTRGFNGEYEITVERSGRKKVVQTKVTMEGQRVKVVLEGGGEDKPAGK